MSSPIDFRTNSHEVECAGFVGPNDRWRHRGKRSSNARHQPERVLSKNARQKPDAGDGAPSNNDGAAGPKLSMDPELEAALRDAVDSVEAEKAAVESDVAADELEIDVESGLRVGAPSASPPASPSASPSVSPSQTDSGAHPDAPGGLGALEPDEIRLTETAPGEFIDEGNRCQDRAGNTGCT